VIEYGLDLATADPGRIVRVHRSIVDRAIYSTLRTYSNDNLVVQPAARNWLRSLVRGDRYTFTLNPKAVFSDGTPVTAG